MIRREDVMDDSANLNDEATYEQSRAKHPRDTFGYWAFMEFAQQSGRSDAQCVRAALRRMETRGIPVRAVDADAILSLADGTTLFFNHGGTVPAEAVIAELDRRQEIEPTPRPRREGDEHGATE